MRNPWNDIPLNDYENHMRSDAVGQLQALNALMKRQLNAYPAATAMVLGVAGGNGLEHVDVNKTKKVYAVDINPAYLKQCRAKFACLDGTAEYLCLDLTEDNVLPHADLVIADLLVEYIGCACLVDNIKKIEPQYVSCVIQQDTAGDGFVSPSPYLHVFDKLEAVHRTIEESALCRAMQDAGYTLCDRDGRRLQNGKALLLATFKKTS